jgi:hypothetical protein
MTSIAGTYFTSWGYDVTDSLYQLGPIVVIGTDNSVVVDGVTMTGAMVADTSVSWTSAAGNPSSAMLAFVFSSSVNAMTFYGYYWTSDDQQPPAVNFYGFDTQPQASLDSWAGTYYSYELVSGSNQTLGNLVISGTTVTFDGATINDPIYTGLYSNGTDTNELAWFTSDGNESNVAISFFNSGGGFFNFNGNIWPAGASRPEGAASDVNNCFGTTQSAADADAVNAEADNAHNAEAGAMMVAMGGANQNAEQAEEVEQAEEAEEAEEADEVEAEEADDAAEGGEDVADEVVEGVADVAEDVIEGAAEVLGLALAAILVVEPDTTPPDTKGHKSKNASGLSAKQLLDLKNGS